MTENLAETQYATGVDIVRGGLALNATGTNNALNYAAYISTPGIAATTMGSDDETRLTNVRNSDYYSPGAGKPGLLYSWVAATGGGSDQSEGDIASGSGSAASSAGRRIQGACPDGWHVPNDYEWNLLEKEIYLHPAAYTTYTSTSDLNENLWLSSYETGTSYRPGSSNTDKTWWGHLMKSNQSINGQTLDGASKSPSEGGFAGLLVGIAGNSWGSYGSDAYFWSSSASSTSNGWHRFLYRVYSGAGRAGTTGKYYRYSLRCKKD
jgi:uncharacterized protein (TIGR02145 family)